MAELKKIWKGTGYNKNVTLKEYKYSDGTIHYEFRDRNYLPGNPSQEEAEEIIKRWRLEEINY